MAENCTHTMHNLYTQRGAEIRDAKVRAQFINESMELFSDKTDVIFASHHWPTWGSVSHNVRGVYQKYHDFLKLFDRFDFWFNIVTP